MELNIDMELESAGMEYREIEADELKSDFDETKGLGIPSVLDLEEVNLDWETDSS